MPYIDSKKFDIYQDIDDKRIKASLFNVDEFIAPIISILNKKGYKTEYCCSGHYDESIYDWGSTKHDNCYIAFKTIKDFNNTINIPKDFILETNKNNTFQFVMRKTYKSKGIERYFEIIDTMKDLIDWAFSLPDKKLK